MPDTVAKPNNDLECFPVDSGHEFDLLASLIEILLINSLEYKSVHSSFSIYPLDAYIN